MTREILKLIYQPQTFEKSVVFLYSKRRTVHDEGISVETKVIKVNFNKELIYKPNSQSATNKQRLELARYFGPGAKAESCILSFILFVRLKSNVKS